MGGLNGAEAADKDAFTFSLDAMQLTPQSQTTLYDLSDDVLRMILLFLSNVDDIGWGQGGMNILRLVSKRLMCVVESCTTTLSNRQGENGPHELPSIMRRCPRIEHIRCDSHNLRSLEGCPVGLKSLKINGRSLESLQPLAKCVDLERLGFRWADQISDLSHLASCTKIKKLSIRFCPITDLSPLSSMPLLEELSIDSCHRVQSLGPLSGLMNLRKLDCEFIDLQTSLLPLALCTGLRELVCSLKAKDLDELKQKMPGLKVNP